jgi:CRP-like cAMP-binding protein
MSEFQPGANRFKDLDSSLRGDIENTRIIKVSKRQPIYTLRNKPEYVYFILRGKVKLLMLSPEGKECLLAIYTQGDILTESGLAGLNEHLETAVAMEDSVVKRIPYLKFLLHLRHQSLLENFIQYLFVGIAEQKQTIANLITVNSEKRLGKILLVLARKLGRPAADLTQIELRITHEELSLMVGTTRPRITDFMKKFRKLGLVRLRNRYFMVINEERLSRYLNSAS